MSVQPHEKRYIIYNGEFVEVQRLSFETKQYTHLGSRIETSVHIKHNGEGKVLRFIQDCDTLEIFKTIDLRAKVHRFLALKSRQKSSYLMGIFFENIKYQVRGDSIHIECDAYSEDGNFGIRQFEGKTRIGVPKRIVELSKEEIVKYLNDRDAYLKGDRM